MAPSFTGPGQEIYCQGNSRHISNISMNIYSRKWIRRHLELAKTVSTWSKDESTKVGCIIVTETGFPKSWSYNGNPMGIVDTPERLERPNKYNYVAHAERNAMDVCRQSVEDCIMFVTHAPCSSCAIGILQNGIKAVIVDNENGVMNESSYINYNEKWKESTAYSIEMFKEAGIMYMEYSFENDKLYHV
jgi:dCMP deaminase